MLNFIQNFAIGILFFALFFWFLSISSGWKELSKKYKVEQYCPSAFITNQQGVFRTPDSNRTSTTLRGLNIGVSEEGLYLYSPFMNDIFYPSLLIPWSEIEYQTSYSQDSEDKRHTFYMGNPVISIIRLYPKAIKKLEEEYGEPIFSNKLGKLS